MNNVFLGIINNLLPFIRWNGEVKDDDWQIADDLLAYVFPAGKYKDKTFGDIIAIDESFDYCLWWTRQNVSKEQYVKLYGFLLKLSFVAKSRKDFKRFKRELEDEEKRREYCMANGINYTLDYEIRHNRNLRDWGM